MKINKMFYYVMFVLLCGTSSVAMIVEKNPEHPEKLKAGTVRKYLKEIDLSAMIKAIVAEDRDHSVSGFAQSLLVPVQCTDLLAMFEPFLQDKIPKKNANNQKNMGILIEEMSVFLRLYYVIFNTLETCRAENIMVTSKEKFEPGVVSPQNNILLEHLVTAYERSDLRPQFLKFQYVSNFFVRLLSAYGYLNQEKNYGTIDTKNIDAIGFIKDSGGYVLFPLNKKSIERLILPYGDSYPDRTRMVVHAYAKIEKSQGYVALKTADPLIPLQISYYSGDYPGCSFIDAPNYLYFSLQAIHLPDTITLKSQRIFAKAILPEVKLEELDQTTCQFFPLPSTPLEIKLLEYFFLEDFIKNNINDENMDYIKMAIGYEGEDKLADEDLIAYKNSMHAELVDLAEAELKAELRALAAENKSYNNSSKNTGKKNHSEIGIQKKSSSKETVYRQAEQQIEMLKVEGRQKWHHVLGLVNEVKKQYPQLRMADLNIAGSHITFHAPDTKSVTLVPKHGKKDVTVPSGRVNSFIEKLIYFAMAMDKK